MGKLIATVIIAVLAFMAVIALVKFLHLYLVFVSILLWLVVLFSFLYINDKGPAFINNNQRIAAGFDWLLAVNAPAQDDHTPATPQVRAPDNTRSPDEALKEALFYLEEGIYGQGQVKQQINDIFSRLENSPHTGLRALSPSDGAIILLRGPQGSGKTIVTSQFISLLYGEKVLETEEIIEADRLDFPPGSDPLDILYTLIDNHQSATLIIHDADFIADPESEAISGHSIGTAIARVAKKDPHCLLVILELSDKAANKMLKDPEHKKWLDKLGTFEFNFQQLDADSLLKILVDYLQDESFSIASDGLPRIKRLIQDIADEAPENFKNAHSMRHLSESLIQSFSSDENNEGTVLTPAFISGYIAAR